MKRRGFLVGLLALPIIAPIVKAAAPELLIEGPVAPAPNPFVPVGPFRPDVEGWLPSAHNMALRRQMAMYAAFIDGETKVFYLDGEGVKTTVGTCITCRTQSGESVV